MYRILNDFLNFIFRKINVSVWICAILKFFVRIQELKLDRTLMYYAKQNRTHTTLPMKSKINFLLYKLFLLSGYLHNIVEGFISTRSFVSAGRLCAWVHNSSHRYSVDDYPTYPKFRYSLKLQCSEGDPAILHWTPNASVPDLLYYQVNGSTWNLNTVCIVLLKYFKVIGEKTKEHLKATKTVTIEH